MKITVIKLVGMQQKLSPNLNKRCNMENKFSILLVCQIDNSQLLIILFFKFSLYYKPTNYFFPFLVHTIRMFCY